MILVPAHIYRASLRTMVYQEYAVCNMKLAVLGAGGCSSLRCYILV